MKEWVEERIGYGCETLTRLFYFNYSNAINVYFKNFLLYISILYQINVFYFERFSPPGREAPVAKLYPEERVIAQPGQDTLFQCHLTAGIPSPTIKWERQDGRPLSPNTALREGGVIRCDVWIHILDSQYSNQYRKATQY